MSDPKTLAERRASGSRDRDRRPPAATVAPRHGKPRSPSGLGPPGRAAWRSAWAGGWLTDADRSGIEHLARMVDDRAEIDARIRADGLTLPGSRGQAAPHPLLAARARLDGAIRTALDSYGLSAVGRRRLAIETREPPPSDPGEEFFGAMLDRKRAQRSGIG